jgi:ABC-type multidrug transport system permease subunit
MTNSGSRTNPFIYAFAAASGIFSGWVNQMVDDALLTALCMVGFAMLFGVWKPQQPWRWVLLVWIGLPLALGYYQFIVKWPHDRGQVYAVFLQLLAASAGGFGGHFMRTMVENVFLKKNE